MQAVGGKFQARQNHEIISQNFADFTVDNREKPMAIRMKRLLASGALFFVIADLSADELVRDASLIETIPIQGITLAMTPKEAFDYLFEQGFSAGDFEKFEDWQETGIEFVRGVYGSPDGHTSLALSRDGERIVQISETYSQPGRPLDAVSEIGSVRRYFGITDDTPKCKAANPHYGNCRVQDVTEAQDVDLVYGLQVMSIMRTSYATRKKELASSLR